jgi:hypothetical protein
MAPILQGSRVTRRRARQVLLRRALAFGGCARCVDDGVAGLVGGGKCVALERDLDPVGGAGVALVGRGGRCCGCGRVEGGQNVAAGRGEVAGGAGFDLADPGRIPAGVGAYLDVPAVGLWLPEYHTSCPASQGAPRRVDGINVPPRPTHAHCSCTAWARTSCGSGACAAITSIAACRYRQRVAMLTRASAARIRSSVASRNRRNTTTAWTNGLAARRHGRASWILRWAAGRPATRRTVSAGTSRVPR